MHVDRKLAKGLISNSEIFIGKIILPFINNLGETSKNRNNVTVGVYIDFITRLNYTFFPKILLNSYFVVYFMIVFLKYVK